MLEIWWIRHGQSLWNAEGRWQGQSDVELSPLGRQQAENLGQQLQNVSFDLVFCSSMRRAQETARLALPRANIRSDIRLREMDFGEYEGLTRADMSSEQWQRLSQWIEQPFGHTIAGGECLVQVQQRVQQWQSELPPQGRVAVFGHGGVIRCRLWADLGHPSLSMWQVAIDNCSTTCLSYHPQPRVQWVNQSCRA